MISVWFVSTFAISLLFAMNIGASGTAATLSAAYGGGAVNRITAVSLAALFSMIGANWGGKKVVATISEGIIPHQLITSEIAMIILLSACLSLFLANRMGIPLSTSEVTVGSIVGVGLAIHHIYWIQLLIIVISWILLPFFAFGIAYTVSRLSTVISHNGKWKLSPMLTHLLSILLVLAGCYEAFSAGMNNVANAMGPVVGAGMIGSKNGIFIGSIFLGLGAIFMGSKVLETNGKNITLLSKWQGIIVSFTSGTLVVIASFFGLPVPLTQATTMAIMGVGSEKVGRKLFHKPLVKKIFKIWIFSPISSLILSLLLVKIVVFESYIYLMVFMLLSIGFLFYSYFRIKSSVY